LIRATSANPGAAIISAADEFKSRCIILGSLGAKSKTFSKKSILGSTSKYVVERANCNVLVVRNLSEKVPTNLKGLIKASDSNNLYTSKDKFGERFLRYMIGEQNEDKESNEKKKYNEKFSDEKEFEDKQFELNEKKTKEKYRKETEHEERNPFESKTKEKHMREETHEETYPVESIQKQYDIKDAGHMETMENLENKAGV